MNRKEQEKTLLDFFMYFREFGEQKIGQSMEQFISDFLESRK